MQAFIRHRDSANDYYTEELCTINELSNTAADPHVSIAEARVAPGVTTRWHRLHGIVERYVMLRGSGLVDVGELAPTRVEPGSVVVIPAGCPQRISNTGQTELVFLAVCSPRFQQQHYEDAEELMSGRNRDKVR
jgi:mannose-6-phosphate isomerase-like protein (cupin superfamily)